MRYSILLLYLFTCQVCFSQVDSALIRRVVTSTVCLLIKGKYKNIDTVWQGNGFLVNGSHVATCYHVFGDSNFKAKEIKVFYVNEKITEYDYVTATLKGPTASNMYDFTRHIYFEEKRESDFVILTLDKKVHFQDIHFDTNHISLGTKLIAARHSYTSGLNSIKVDITSQNVVYHVLGPDSIGILETASIGFAENGYSGSPIFNQSGFIVGIISAGMSPKNSRLFLYEMIERAGGFSNTATQILKKMDAIPGSRIAFSTNMKYLLRFYFKGFKIKH